MTLHCTWLMNAARLKQMATGWSYSVSLPGETFQIAG
jgi:hypothetical protein